MIKEIKGKIKDVVLNKIVAEDKILEQKEILRKSIIENKKRLKKNHQDQKNKNKKIITNIFLFLAFLALLGSIFYFFKNKGFLEQKNTKNAQKENAQGIEKDEGEENNKKEGLSDSDLLDPFSQKSTKSTKTFYGKVFNDNTFDIFSKTSGEVLYVLKDEGEYISKGDLLLKVNDKYILQDIEKSKISKEQARLNLEKLITSEPDLEDFQKIDKNMENLKLAILGIEDNIEKTKTDIEVEENNISVDNIELSIANIENQKNRTQKDIDLELDSLVDLFKDLAENDVESYFVEDSNGDKRFRYLLADIKDEERLEKYRIEINDSANKLRLKKEENGKITMSDVSSAVELFSEYYDFLHHVSFDILLLNDRDLQIVEKKTESGKKILNGKKTLLNNYYLALENFDSAIDQNKKQIENTELGKTKTMLALENALKSLDNQKEQTENQIELLEIDKKKIIKNYIPESEDVASANLAIDSADENIKTLKERLRDTSLYSPVSGKIITRNVDKAGYINPGTFLMKVEGSDISRVNIFVPEDISLKLKKNQKVLIEKIYKGKIIDIDDRVDIKTGKIKVEISLKKKIKELIVDKVVSADIKFSVDKDFVSVPLKAVFADIDGKNFVFVKDKKGRIKNREIKIINFRNTYVEVQKDDFKEGDLVVKNKALI